MPNYLMPDKTPVDVSIVLVSRNTRAATMACLEALPAASEGLDTEVIAVDNGSTDGSGEEMSSHALAPWLISCGLDHGFRKAAVLGATMAIGKYLLVMRSDIVPVPASITQLVAAARRHPECGVWGGQILVAPSGRSPGLRSPVTDLFLLMDRAAWPEISCFARPDGHPRTVTVWTEAAKLLGHQPRLVAEAIALAHEDVDLPGALTVVPGNQAPRAAGTAETGDITGPARRKPIR